MIVLDSSVVIAGFGAWHEHHDVARQILADTPCLVAHAELESYSVLTRLPAPFRADPPTVAAFLERTFTSPRLVLGADEHAKLPGKLARLGISGGSVYDALIAFTVRAAEGELVTLDRRALDTYQRCRVSVRLLSEQ